MSETGLHVVSNTYLDSVKLLSGARSLQETSGVEWGTVVMGTAANLEQLVDMGFGDATERDIGGNDLVIAVRAESEEVVQTAVENARKDMFAEAAGSSEENEETRFRSLLEAAKMEPPPNLAVISVSGPYAALEAHKALTAGMDALLFSDNVPIDREVELKQRARSLARYVMGPGAGTAMVDGVGLGFSNVVDRGQVGIVAAAGTGAQEAMALVHRAGLGVSQVIGVGGRDLSEEVGGLMTTMALDSLEADPDTEALLLVSKPPSPDVARRILAASRSKPLVAALIGLQGSIDAAEVTVTTTLEDGVAAACRSLGVEPSWLGESHAETVEGRMERLPANRTAVRGLFSGGTLCYEAMTLMAGAGFSVFSNTPLRPEWALDNASEDSHICLDLGEEEFTKNRPHPMIDPEARLERLETEAEADQTAVLLMDVVLGHGSHEDPAGVYVPALEKVTERSEGPAVVVYVLGTDRDPQGLDAQRGRFREAGCIVPSTNKQAALVAAALAARDRSPFESSAGREPIEA